MAFYFYFGNLSRLHSVTAAKNPSRTRGELNNLLFYFEKFLLLFKLY